MGLKLHHIDIHGSAGELDGQPFRLEADDTGWRAEIGTGGGAWKHKSPLAASGRRAAAEIRNLTYQAIAVYRQFQRGRTLHA
ncbi:hypothetical protein [Leisingera caerulea]|uniref:hypothetical protein n=1 Tax=Leisingera caerulea TaxID=506591 RepID=UPI00040213BF|nr:hypothetical protein [Leisingera caerulea]